VRHDPHTAIHDAVADMLTGQTVKAVLHIRHPSGLEMQAWKCEGWTAMRVGAGDGASAARGEQLRTQQPMTARMMHLNLFVFGCGHHRGAWRHPHSSVERLGDIRYYEHLAQTAERGKLDAVFFADGHAVGNVADGSAWFLEPLTTLAAISRATERIGLISTVSSTFATPFHTARQVASLDHISGGRMGWNVVTSMFDVEARNHGYEAMPAHAERYRRAEEFVAAVLKLWDSWTDDALQCDRGGQYADPAKVRPIHHRGEYFRVDGPLNVPRPPQGHPVLFQAGASEQGRALAARRAEAIYAVAWDLPTAQAY
jgi:FMN-dependent oxidoreductase (nitrilotriacetate monooxygenase family)